MQGRNKEAEELRCFSALLVLFYWKKTIYFTDSGLIPPGNTALAILLITTLKIILVQEGKKECIANATKLFSVT